MIERNERFFIFSNKFFFSLNIKLNIKNKYNNNNNNQKMITDFDDYIKYNQKIIIKKQKKRSAVLRR